MKYYCRVDDQTYEITIDGAESVSIEGEPVGADMQRIGAMDLYSLLLDNVSHEVLVEPVPDRPNTYSVMVSGTRYVVTVEDQRTRRLAMANHRLKPPQGELVIRAPIPGLVVKVFVTAGQTVAEGDTLLVLEAMKMENELRAPRAGTIHDVRAEPGAQVTLGQVLVTVR